MAKSQAPSIKSQTNDEARMTNEVQWREAIPSVIGNWDLFVVCCL
jgi:hypothetical protein